MGIFKKKVTDDAALIAGCITNDRRMQEGLYRKYFSTLFYMGLKYTQDEDLVQELTHDAFIKVFKNIHKYQSIGSFEGWMRKIMFHCVVDHFRAKKNPRFIEIEEIRQMLDNNTGNQIDFDDLIQDINGLPEVHKNVFNMFAIEGYSHQEIAQKIGITEGTSKWYLNQARTLLKEKIAQKNKYESYARQN